MCKTRKTHKVFPHEKHEAEWTKTSETHPPFSAAPSSEQSFTIKAETFLSKENFNQGRSTSKTTTTHRTDVVVCRVGLRTGGGRSLPLLSWAWVLLLCWVASSGAFSGWVRCGVVHVSVINRLALLVFGWPKLCTFCPAVFFMVVEFGEVIEFWLDCVFNVAG